MRGSDNNSNRRSKGGNNSNGNSSPYSKNNKRSRRRTKGSSSGQSNSGNSGNNSSRNNNSGSKNSSGRSRKSGNKKVRAARAAKTAYDTHKNADNDPKDPLQKRITNTVVLLIFTWAPYVDLDYFSLPILYHLFSPLSGVLVSLGDSMYDLTDIPILSFITKRFALTFWLFQPVANVDHVGLHYLAEKGLTKIFARYSDNIADIVLGIASAGTVPVALNFVTFFMDSSFWRILKEWNLDKKIRDHGPHFMASAVMFGAATFLGESSQNSKSNSNTARNSNQGKRLMTDGGRDQNRNPNRNSQNNRNSSNNQNIRSPNNQYRDIQPMQKKSLGEKILAIIKWPFLFIIGLIPFVGGSKDSRGRTSDHRGSDTARRTTHNYYQQNNNKAGGSGGGIGVKMLVFSLIGLFLVVGLVVVPGLVSGSPEDGGSGSCTGLSGYLCSLTNTFNNAAAGSVAPAMEDTVNTYQQARARVFCLLKGPACLRQWRLNNTERPGSNEVGQNYGLDVDSYSVGQGSQVDVAYKEADYAFPVSFKISNPRHGLKGIDARNVSYRIRFVDGVDQLDDPVCDTDWIAVHTGYDLDGDGQFDDIYPGTSASTSFLKLNEEFRDSSDEKRYYNESGDLLTLKDCNMLQPSLGDTITAVLDVKYNYFSQATLYFQAMSRQNLEENPDVEISNKKSETADTPVKAAVNVNSPVLFNSDRSPDSASQPFSLRATLNTDKGDIEYQVRDLYVINSGLINQYDDGALCDFGDENGGYIDENDIMRPLISQNNVFKPGYKGSVDQNSPAANMFPESQDAIADEDNRRREEYYWFDSSRKPPMFGCNMKISDTTQINPTGETLTVGVKSNYTVAKRDRLGNVQFENTVCTTFNCPLLVTVQKDEDIPDYDFDNECRGVDSSKGCSIIDFSSLNPGDSNSWGSVQTKRYSANRQPEGSDEEYTEYNIDSGDIALNLGSVSGVNEGVLRGTGFGGVEESIWDNLDPDLDGTVDGPVQDNYTMVQFVDRDDQWTVELEEDCVRKSEAEEEEDYNVLARWGPGCTAAPASETKKGSSSTSGGSCVGSNICTGLTTQSQCQSSGICTWNSG